MRPVRPRAVAAVALAVVGLAGCGGEGVTRRAGPTTTESVPAEGPAASTTTTTTTGPPVTTAAPPAVPPADPPEDLGADADLDRLAAACAAGQFASCDTLFFNSPPDSAYEAYGDTCGGRNEPGGLCTEIYGRGTEPAS